LSDAIGLQPVLQLEATYGLDQFVVVAQVQRGRAAGTGEQQFAQQRAALVTHSGAQRRAARQRAPGRQGCLALPGIGRTQVAVQGVRRARAIECPRQIG